MAKASAAGIVSVPVLRALLLALACLPALAQEPAFILERREIAAPSALPAASLKLRLSLALLEDAGWEAERVLDAVREAIAVLAQCDIALEGAELVRIRAPVGYHDFLTPLSRRLAAAVPLARPAIWFVRDGHSGPP
ncbi:MAG: hypothetical protein FJY47_07755 [Betaproteobacteria bacterium]|nr:hypothetical protein [Betaproteobacteria bacterium]